MGGLEKRGKKVKMRLSLLKGEEDRHRPQRGGSGGSEKAGECKCHAQCPMAESVSGSASLKGETTKRKKALKGGPENGPRSNRGPVLIWDSERGQLLLIGGGPRKE